MDKNIFGRGEWIKISTDTETYPLIHTGIGPCQYATPVFYCKFVFNPNCKNIVKKPFESTDVLRIPIKYWSLRYFD